MRQNGINRLVDLVWIRGVLTKKVEFLCLKIVLKFEQSSQNKWRTPLLDFMQQQTYMPARNPQKVQYSGNLKIHDIFRKNPLPSNCLYQTVFLNLIHEIIP